MNARLLGIPRRLVLFVHFTTHSSTKVINNLQIEAWRSHPMSRLPIYALLTWRSDLALIVV